MADIPPEAITAALGALGKHADMHMWLTAAEGTAGGLLMRKELLTRAVAAADPVIRADERAKWTRIEPDPDQAGYNRGVFDISAMVAEAVAAAVAAERERAAFMDQDAVLRQATCTSDEATGCYFADLIGGQP